MSAVALRPYLPADARRCAEIFRASIEELAAEDYDAEQREAWASEGRRRRASAKRFSAALTLLAVIDQQMSASPASRAERKSTCSLSLPTFARQGVAGDADRSVDEAR